MSSPNISLLYGRYRGQSAPIPCPESLDELGNMIEARVKPGLTKLLGRTGISPVEYAGYALPQFLTPIEMMELFKAFGGQETIDELKSAGLNVDTTKQRDDFWVQHFDHFDQMQDPKDDGVWLQRRNNETGLNELGIHFLLGPVVRGPIHIFGNNDEFNQKAEADFDHQSAVYVSSRLLLEGLYEYRPQLQDGRSIAGRLVPDFFTERFDMQPSIQLPTTYVW